MRKKAKTIALLTVTALGTLHVINLCVNAAATAKKFLSKEKKLYFEWREEQVFYSKTGVGSPILLIHDLSPYSSSYEWNFVVKALSKDHTVYTIDLPGCGRSDKESITYTNYFYVQFLESFVKNVIREKTDVVVSGFSASFLTMVCSTNQDLFGKLIFINPESVFNMARTPGRHSRIAKFIIDLPIIGTTIYQFASSKKNIEYLFMEDYFYNPFLVDKKMPLIFYESSHLGNSRGKYLYASLYGNYLTVDISDALCGLKNDILILEGSNAANGKIITNSYQNLNQNIQIRQIRETKRYPHMENPEAVIEQINRFL